MTVVNRKDGVEMDANGDEFGKDPRKLSKEQLNNLGHEAKPVLTALRERCIDCSGGNTAEVRRCTALGCPLWPFRMGTNPWRAERELSDEQREAMAERLRAIRPGNRVVEKSAA